MFPTGKYTLSSLVEPRSLDALVYASTTSCAEAATSAGWLLCLLAAEVAPLRSAIVSHPGLLQVRTEEP